MKLQAYAPNGKYIKNLKDYISPIVKLLQHYKVDAGLIKQYNSFMDVELERNTEERGDQQVTEKQKENYVPLTTIEKDIKKYQIFDAKGKVDPERLENKVIMMLYFNNYFVGRNDYPEMKITNQNNIKKLNKNYNHLLVDPKTGLPTKFVLHKYKTHSKFGRQEFAVPKDLAIALQLYMSVFNKKIGDFLFTSKTGKEYNPSNFLKNIQRASTAIIGKPLGVDLIRNRIIHYTNFYNNAKKPSIDDKKAFAKRFLHDMAVGNEYQRLNLEGTSRKPPS